MLAMCSAKAVAPGRDKPLLQVQALADLRSSWLTCYSTCV